MGNPTGDGEYRDGDYKHDCPVPLTGCRFPKCRCDVDESALSHKEEQAIESLEKHMEDRNYEDIVVEGYMKD